MRLASLRPAYFFPRVRQIMFERRHPDCPWLTPAAILLLENWLKGTDRGFEWGSGRSTLWFAQRVSYMVSIEDNAEWHDHVRKSLNQKGLMEKVEHRFIACDWVERSEPVAHPYADAIEEFADDSFDFVLVDGNIRLPCMRKAQAKLKPGGLLVLDNADRYFPNHFVGEFSSVTEPRSEPRSPGWVEMGEKLKGWRWINTTNRIWDTRFWVKPPN